MAGRTIDPDTLARRIERYRDDPHPATVAATIGRRLWAGEQVTSAEVEALGKSAALVGVIARDFETAGYHVTRRRVSGTNAVAYSLDGAPDDVRRNPIRPSPARGRRATPRGPTPHPTRDSALEGNVGGGLERVEPVLPSNGARRPVYAHEVPGIAYPALGALLGVRAVALVDGELVLHLADGEGVWQVRVTGHAPT